MTSRSPSDMLSQAQKTKGKKMVRDIYTWWKTIRKAGILIHNNEEHYALNPQNWRYTPEYLLSNNDVYDFKMLESNWEDNKEEYEFAKKILKEYEKKAKKILKDHKKKLKKKTEKKKKRCPNGTRRNKKTGKCEKK